MRYYEIKITNAETGQLYIPSVFANSGFQASYTSFANNKTLPGALDIELDLNVVDYSVTNASSWVRIWGITLEEISQAVDLGPQRNGKATHNVQIFGGMKKGLPLADPSQARLLAEGSIFQAFGNWVGTDMTLDLLFMPAAGSPDEPRNAAFNWKKGTSLKDVIIQVASTAFPEYTIDVSGVSSTFKLAEDQPFAYESISQFASWVRTVSKDIANKDDYKGLATAILPNKIIRVFDGSTGTTPKELEFKDMIGQPTWIGPVTIQTKLVMRGDIQMGDFIRFPKGLVIETARGLAAFRNRAAFQGVFNVINVRHVGRYRQPDAASWVTILDAVATTV